MDPELDKENTFCDAWNSGIHISSGYGAPNGFS